MCSRVGWQSFDSGQKWIEMNNSFTCIICTVVFSVTPVGGLVLDGLFDKGEGCLTGEVCGSVLVMFPPLISMLPPLLMLCDLVSGGGMIAEGPVPI